MKALALIALTFVPAFAQAVRSNAADIRCYSEKTRKTYIVKERFGEIQAYDRNGRDLGHLDSISFSSRRAGATVITTVTHEEGDVVAKIYMTAPKEISMDYHEMNETNLKCAYVQK